MTTTAPTIKLGFEFNAGADDTADCARCHGSLDEPDGTRFVAVVLNVGDPLAGRICETCSDELKPGLWEIAEGMDSIFFGLLSLTEGERWAASLRISMFVSKMADSMGSGQGENADTPQTWAEQLTTTH